MAIGLTYSWGVIQASLTREQLASDGTLSFIGSLSTSLVAIAAFLNTRVVRWLGTRNSGLVSVAFIGLGQILCGSATRSVSGLFVANGLVTGYGVSLGFMVRSFSCFNEPRRSG
jgi:cyanate permease